MANNGDELLSTGLKFEGPGSADVIAIGNFHKTLPHNKFGEVDPAAYAQFKLTAITGGDYETIPRGYMGNPIPFQDGFVVNDHPLLSDNLNNPQAARSHDKLSGSSSAYMMPPAPSVRSKSTAAEFAELQWMAILRDIPFIDFGTNAQIPDAVTDLQKQFGEALSAHEPGGLQLGVDLPHNSLGKLDLRKQTLFRCGLLGEDKGPPVSQFFIHDIAYGAQFIEQKVRPYKHGRNFLTKHGSWLRAQNAGFDEWGHGYAGDNDFNSDPTLEEPGGPRRISTMRDMARFVNKDALHQAYFNAAMQCLNWGVLPDPGNPYLTYKRQSAFGTFGGPDILTRVSEVASRALEVVWRQKWEVHRRLRPEAYGGLMQMQAVGLKEGMTFTKRAYGIPDMAFQSAAAKFLFTQGTDKNYYLPIAFTAGSPPHPAYGAGHATVAGACITVLKAWFAEKTYLKAHLTAKLPKSPFGTAPPNESPIAISSVDSTGTLVPYTGADIDEITVEGELNKIACNVAMGRSMGGVHWRSDNTRSLRLGEQIAAELLRSESQDYAEKRKPANTPPVWSFTSFNGDDVVIFEGKVLVNSVAVNPESSPL
jgi:hypothetical protein